MKEVLFEDSPEFFRKVPGLIKQGIRLLCPKCRSELIVALDPESAALHRVHPGIYCPQNSDHVGVMVELVSSRSILDDMESMKRSE